MFPLLRYFSIASAAALLTATAIVMWQYNHGIKHYAADQSEVSNSILGRSLTNAIWQEFGAHLTSSPELNREELRTHPMTRRLTEVIGRQIEGLPVSKVKIYNSEGLTMFSTDQGQIGEDKSKSPGVVAALSGEITTELSQKGREGAFGHASETTDIVATYLPIRNSEGHPEAAIEFYRDVTHLMDEIRSTQLTVGAVVFVVFWSLYIVLFILIRRAGTVLKTQHQEILGQKKELSEEIRERVRAEEALRNLNDDLEKRVAEGSDQLRATQEDLSRKQRLATLGQLIGSVGHDLRNPLGTIRNSLAAIAVLAEQAGLNLKRPLERTERSVQRCESIISDLLDHTRVRDLQLAPTAIDPWLEAVLDELTLPEGIALRRDLSADGMAVPLDADRFRRVVVNLFDNACQAMAGNQDAPGGDPRHRLTVTTRTLEERVEISFDDTGAGIPPDLMSKIFEPLFTTKTDGVGLGLPMVKQIVDQHGGEIDIGRNVGGGARITLQLPRHQAGEEAA